MMTDIDFVQSEMAAIAARIQDIWGHLPEVPDAGTKQFELHRKFATALDAVDAIRKLASPEMQKMMADIDAAAAQVSDLFPDVRQKIHVRHGGSTWWKRIPRTENRVADLAGFFRWANYRISAADTRWVLAEVFKDLTPEEVDRAYELAK